MMYDTPLDIIAIILGAMAFTALCYGVCYILITGLSYILNSL